jgi:anti-anti-sigma factor
MVLNKIYDNNSLKVILSNEVKAEDFNDIIYDVKNKGEIKLLKLDLRNVLYMYSKDVANLINLKKVCDEKKIELILTNVSESITQLLEITDLITLFRIEEDYSSYSADELVRLFLDPEKADFMTDYLAHHYTDEIKNKIHSLIWSDDPLLREYAIITAGKAQDFSSIEAIRDALTDDVVPVVRAAALVAGWLNDIESMDYLYNLLNSECLDVVEGAAISIALMADEKDSSIIGKLLSSNDERKRCIAVKALGLINDDVSYNLLMEQYKKEANLAIKALILRTLSFFKKPGLVDFFVKELASNVIEIQEAATSSLVRLRAVDKVDYLLSMLNAENSWVSFFAIKALGELADKVDIIEKLRDFYNKADLHVKIAIVEAITKICCRVKTYDKSEIVSFMKELLKENNEDIRKEVFNALMILSKEECIKAALSLINTEKSWIVRLKIVEILGTLKPEGYASILRDHLKNEDNRYVIEKIQGII